MPVHERLHKDGDTTDLSQEAFKKGLAGRAGGPVEAATSVVKESSGNTGAEGDTDQDQISPLGTSNISPPTGLSVAGGGSTGEIDVTYTAPSGISTVELVVYEDEAGVADTVGQRFKLFQVKVDSTASPETIADLTSGTTYRVFARGISDDGAVGRAASATGAAT